MTLIEGTSINICLFPPQSINLISATTNSGKTYFITEILNNPHLFFVKNSIHNVYYINANSQALNDPPVIDHLNLLSLDDIEFFDLFESNDVIIIDDLLFLTPELIQFLKYTVHHKNLIVFLITQNLIGDKLFALTYLIHNIVLILRSSAAVRIALELLQRFFIANDTKLYLKNIISSGFSDQ